MLLWLATPFVALVLAGVGVRFGLPAYHHWQHGRCLGRIELLERELGMRSDSLGNRIASAASKWATNLSMVHASYDGPRTIVYCTACLRDVVREVGVCRGAPAGCVKRWST